MIEIFSGWFTSIEADADELSSDLLISSWDVMVP
jgi:hypothetical protein